MSLRISSFPGWLAAELLLVGCGGHQRLQQLLPVAHPPGGIEKGAVDAAGSRAPPAAPAGRRSCRARRRSGLARPVPGGCHGTQTCPRPRGAGRRAAAGRDRSSDRLCRSRRSSSPAGVRNRPVRAVAPARTPVAEGIVLVGAGCRENRRQHRPGRNVYGTILISILPFVEIALNDEAFKNGAAAPATYTVAADLPKWKQHHGLGRRGNQQRAATRRISGCYIPRHGS